jgi:hypothetical protein
MGRIGLPASGVDVWLPQLRKLDALEPEGVFSHFSHAESVEGNYTRTQLELFKKVLESLARHSSTPKHVHLANSAAVITLPEAHFNMARPGLMLYGVHPSPAMTGRISLKPALSWRTRITQLKRVPRLEYQLRPDVRHATGESHRNASGRLRRRLSQALFQSGSRAGRWSKGAGGRDSLHGFDDGGCYRYTECSFRRRGRSSRSPTEREYFGGGDGVVGKYHFVRDFHVDRRQGPTRVRRFQPREKFGGIRIRG